MPGPVCEYKKWVFVSPLLTPSKMSLELLMGRSASPHLKSLSGLANLFAHVSPLALPPQGQDFVGKMANIYGS